MSKKEEEEEEGGRRRRENKTWQQRNRSNIGKWKKNKQTSRERGKEYMATYMDCLQGSRIISRVKFPDVLGEKILGQHVSRLHVSFKINTQTSMSIIMW